jgi:hypothetical protein
MEMSVEPHGNRRQLTPVDQTFRHRHTLRLTVALGEARLSQAWGHISRGEE